MKNKFKNNKGITLVALVVTIVVLLILAGVSINLVVGQNGIINKAKDAKKNYINAAGEEKQGVENIDSWVDEELLPQMEKVSVNNKATANGTINGKKATAMNPIIPQGYIPINQGKAVWGDGTTAPTETSVNNGLVIKDETGNEWVWVPVPNPSELYEAKSDTITQGEVNVTTQNYTKSEILPGKTRGIPNSEDWREPGILTDTTYADGKQEYRIQAGFTTLQDMTENLVKDYNEMIGSLEKYHGFYIGRYELSAQGEKKGGTVGSQSWYTAYKQAKNIIPSEAKGKVETRMIWGLQWDATCNWIANNGDKKDINNSSSWGNYSDSTTPANVSGAGSRQVTGFSEKWKANNIYDLAGNCLEWTQEALNTNYRADRGGSYGNSGSGLPVSFRGYYYPYDSYGFVSSRSTLYVK